VTPRATLRWFGITTFVLAVAGPATAQSTGGSTPSNQTPTGGLVFQNTPPASLQEQLSQATTIVNSILAAAKTVKHQLGQARQQRDVVKSLCLNDKASQADAQANSATGRLAALQAAVQANDGDNAAHQFAIITAQGQNTAQVTSDANQCIGTDVAFIGSTAVSVVIDDGIVDVVEEVNGVVTIIQIPPPPASVTPIGQ
jgi:hypothetical protein